MENEKKEKLVKEGRRAAERHSSRFNARNAHEFGASSLCQRLSNGSNKVESILWAQQAANMSLTALLSLTKDEWREGLVFFCQGAYEWLEENPD